MSARAQTRGGGARASGLTEKARGFGARGGSWFTVKVSPVFVVKVKDMTT